MLSPEFVWKSSKAAGFMFLCSVSGMLMTHYVVYSDFWNILPFAASWKDWYAAIHTPHLAFQNRGPHNTARNTITFHFSEVFMCTVRQITYSCPVELPFIVTTRLSQRNRSCWRRSVIQSNLRQRLWQMQALKAAVKAREVEKVSQGCPFNRIG
jgi:hypothetical protein